MGDEKEKEGGRKGVNETEGRGGEREGWESGVVQEVTQGPPLPSLVS